LNTTLWRLRKLLECYPARKGTYLASTAQGEIGLATSDNVWIDIKYFEETARKIMSPGDTTNVCAEQFDSTVALYIGDAFEGLYHDWAIRERERLQLIFLECLRSQMQRFARQRNYIGAIACGTKILERDPLQESVHRSIINLHLEHGNRGLAARQFNVCRQLLENELGVQPEPQTMELRRLLNCQTQDKKLPAKLEQLRQRLGEIRNLLDIVERQMEGLSSVGGQGS
jgi:DNA-binding SARP family transcriptional activator